MGLFHHRPLFLWCAAFTGAAAGGYLLFDGWAGSAVSPWALLLCLLAVMGTGGAVLGGILWSRSHRRGVTAWLACLTAILGLTRSYVIFAGQTASYFKELVGETVTVEAVVTERRGEGGYLSSFALELLTVNRQSCEGSVVLTCHYLADLTPGEAVRICAEAVSLEEAAGDGYSAGALRGDGYVMGLLSESEEDMETIAHTSPVWAVRVGEVRRTLAARLNLLTKEASGLPSALLLGDKSALRDEVRRDFARAGVSHLLAISGLHVTLLFGLADGILRLCRLRKQWRAILLGTLALGYLILLGFPASATRAVIMLGVTYLSVLLSARADAVTSLGCAGVIILLCSPHTVADAGFWMSYLATLGLVAVMPWVNTYISRRLSAGRRSLWRRCAEGWLCKVGVGLLVGVIAMSCTLSVVAAVIGEMGILSPVCTLLLTPFCGVILLLSVPAIPLFATGLGDLLGGMISELCLWMTDIAARLAEPRWVVVSLVHPMVLPLSILMAAALLVLLAIRLPSRRRWMMVLPLVIGWTLIGGTSAVADWANGDKPAVSFLQPSSQSDLLVLVEGRDAMICDFSNGSLSSLTAATTEASRCGATEIAVLMLTHYHRRTVGSLGDIFAREMVRELWLPMPTTEEEYDLLRAYCEKAEAAGVSSVLYEPGEVLYVFGSCELTLREAELARSVQPVHLLTLDVEPSVWHDGCLVYCGASVFESELGTDAETAISRADAVIFGNHGPLLKQNFGAGLTFREDVQIVLSERGDTVDYFRADSLPEAGSLWLGQWRFEWTEKRSKS